MFKINKDMLNHKKISIALGLLLILAVFSITTLYRKLSNAQNPDKKVKEEVDKTLSQVGKLMVLPTGEIPTVANVTDPSKLKDQPFFANAKEGDKVLIYEQSRKAILYSPSLNKIIEVSPINLPSPQQ